LSFAAWSWAVRDTKEKPPAGQLGVLFMLGSHMDPVTGCGWASREDLIRECKVAKDTVTRATIWAIEQGLLRNLVRGHRKGDGKPTYSRWALIDPNVLVPADDISRAQRTVLENGSQERSRRPLRTSQRPSPAFSRAQERVPSSKTKSVRPKEPTAAPAGPDISRAQQTVVENLPAVPGPGRDLELINGTVAAPAATAQTLVGEWVDHCPHRPPGRVVGQIAKLIGEMLDEGQPYEAVRAGLALWHQKGTTHPATLPSFVHQAMNGQGGGLLGKGDQRELRGAALTEYYRQLEEDQEGT
jgi:hypothetical protein